MTGKVDKVILTNVSALRSRYGPSGVRAIRFGISELVVADRARGISTKFIAVDDLRMMRALSAPAVTHAIDARQNKRAVDHIYAKLAPDYILLLGSVDVIPHQRLHNPLYTDPRGDDTDPHAAGDLPYACEANYSQDVQNFIGPTRVVGRLPDIAGAKEPSYLLELLKTAAAAKPAEPEQYSDYFAISAQIWERSTRLSARRIFKNSRSVVTVPPKSSRWPVNLLDRRIHLINCHGASRASEFFGQPATGKEQYPIALKSSYIDGKIAPGTVAAAECCYGAQLEPVSPARPRLGICEVYLKNGGYGFVGSTTIAYGDFERNGDADLICQFFLEGVLQGASLGRAFLEARQRFIREASPLDPAERKTIAQFNLYGDPSLTPVSSGGPITLSKRPKSLATAQVERSERHDRRRALFQQGAALAEQEPMMRRSLTKPALSVHRALRAKAREFKLQPGAMLSFAIRNSAQPQTMPRELAAKSSLPVAYHVLFCSVTGSVGRAEARGLGIYNIVALIGKEVNGELAAFTRIHSH